jgi:predicted ATPase with chaperone activity
MLDWGSGRCLRNLDRASLRTPPHTIADVGLIGGGQVPLPGEVSLAHHGSLFWDERPEFKRHVLEVRRQPLEDRLVSVAFDRHIAPGIVICYRRTPRN